MSPGLVNTAMTYWVPQQPDWEQQLKYYGGFPRLAEVQELGGAYVYLLSDAASYATSIDIPVNGVIGSKYFWVKTTLTEADRSSSMLVSAGAETGRVDNCFMLVEYINPSRHIIDTFVIISSGQSRDMTRPSQFHMPFLPMVSCPFSLQLGFVPHSETIQSYITEADDVELDLFDIQEIIFWCVV